MTKKEINEIRSQYTLENCGILKLCGCYVDGDKNKVTRLKETFLNLPEEEQHKYFDIFKKTLSGTQGKSLLDMQFTMDAYAPEGSREFLLKLRQDGLESDELLDEFYDRVIGSYEYPGNYLILLIHQVYDVPGRTADDLQMEDASEEVYDYILCSICHVTLSKPGLGYDETENTFHDQQQSHMVDVPDIGFLFPAFTDRSTDEDRLLFYTKDADDFQQGILGNVLNCNIPLPAADQKETFQTLVTETLGEDCDYDTLRNIHENLQEIAAEHKAEDRPGPAALDKSSARDLLEKSGVREERLNGFEEHFEKAAGEEGKLLVANVAPARKFEVRTPDVVVKVNPDKADLVETMVIGGKQCLVIQIDERLEVNGISVNPDTGEVIDRTEEEKEQDHGKEEQ